MSLVLNGTDGLSDVDGSAATPAIRGTDANTGIFFPAADTIAFAEGGTEVMRIDSSGNVGIGTASPFFPLDVAGAMRGNSWIGRANVSAPTADAAIYRAADNTLAFSTANTERARIDSSGNLLVGKTTNSTSTGAGVILYGQSTISGYGRIDYVKTASGSFKANEFNYLGSIVGSIQYDNSSTAYVTSSDYRLKHDIAPMTGALAKVAELKPVTYKWKIDGSDGQGFIAHELQEVVPECVKGEKDGVETYTDEDGNEATRPAYQGIDTSFLVATLTAAIQEQQAIITALTARVEALESQP